MAIEVEKFKRLILEMYQGFPNWFYSKMVEDVITISKVRQELVDAKFLIKEQNVIGGKVKRMYMLGPTALPLVSAWESENYAKQTKNLTQWLTILTLILIVFTGTLIALTTAMFIKMF